MTTRTSMPRPRSARGSAPETSASPPVLANGAASDVTKRTLRRRSGWIIRSGRVEAVVDAGEDVVLPLDVGDEGLVQPASLEILVEPGEAQHVLVHPARGVGDRGAGGHDEGPVARLREQQLARGLVEGAPFQALRVRAAAGQLGHALPGHVEVPVDPGVALVA